MSTLPFLLSVADELDNINSQSYMDDFGLGFHPHRQYYRTPTIQLSLPASTDWMQDRQQRCRTHKFVDETQNNVQSSVDGEYDGNNGESNYDDSAADHDDDDAYDADCAAGNRQGRRRRRRDLTSSSDNSYSLDKYDYGGGGGGGTASSMGPTTSASCSHRQQTKYTSALNSNAIDSYNDGNNDGLASTSGNSASTAIDNSMQMYNLNKKCCKNYYRHHGTDDIVATAASKGASRIGGGCSKEKPTTSLHGKCLEGNHSSSDESLQKVTSSIEFLTCFLLKKSRASKSSAGGSGSGSGSSNKKS